MKINFLGTGGGGGIPEIFCNCRICENAREKRGHEIRNRPMAVVNNELCIDLPCDARSSFLEQGFDTVGIKYLLITHSHYDHFLAENLLTRPKEGKPVELFISLGSGREIYEKCRIIGSKPLNGEVWPVCCPNVRFVEKFVSFGFGGYTVVPLPANHDPKVETLNFIITYEGRSILWLHDTGIMLEETLDYIKGIKPRFDFISMDCALARGKYVTDEHMDILQCAKTAETLRHMGCLNENTMIYLSHIGHLVERTHEELLEDACEFGFQVAYDGSEITL